MSADAPLGEFQVELARYQALLELVRRERDALRKADAASVEAVSRDKLACIETLNQCARSRSERLRAAGYSNNAEGLRAWIAARSSTPKESLAVWERIVALVKEVKECNRINGILIASQERYFALAVHALRFADAFDHSYGSDGRPCTPHAARPLAAI